MASENTCISYNKLKDLVLSSNVITNIIVDDVLNTESNHLVSNKTITDNINDISSKINDIAEKYSYNIN